MATVFYARTGLDPNRAQKQAYIPAEEIAQKLGHLATRYFENPPEIDTQAPNRPYGTPTLCVISVDSDEVCARFPKDGYYLFDDLMPDQCSSMLGIPRISQGAAE